VYLQKVIDCKTGLGLKAESNL